MNDLYSRSLSIRWADIDPNFHLRHSVYYDFASQLRIDILDKAGLSVKMMEEQNFGPILIREECVFKREIRLSDEIMIHAKLAKMKPDGAQWTIVHEFYNAKMKLCAILTVDGIWLDTKERKMIKNVPDAIFRVMNTFPKAENFISL